MSQSVLNPFCVGLDVHKDNVWACVHMTFVGSSKPISKTKKFKSNYADLSSMCDWILSFRQKFFSGGYDPANPEFQMIPVYMESTGKYSVPVYNVLEEKGFAPNVVNPMHVRMIKGKKTDQKDCAWIAQLGASGLLFSSYIPDQTIRNARNLSRTRIKLTHTRGDEMRRIQNILVSANIRLDLVFSSVVGDSALRVIEYLLEEENPTLEGVQSRISRLCRIMRFKNDAERKEKEEELLKSFSGAKFSPTQKFELTEAMKRVRQYDQDIQKYESELEDTLSQFKVQLELLETIPGISHLSALVILAEIGADMAQFTDCDHFISWCGLCPASNQSNNKHKSVKIGKGGKYLKPVLTQIVWAAVKGRPYYRAKFERIAKRRGKSAR